MPEKLKVKQLTRARKGKASVASHLNIYNIADS